jgi:hypothetical protein
MRASRIRQRTGWSLAVIGVLAAGFVFGAAERDTGQVDIETVEQAAAVALPDDFTVRARVAAISPEEPTAIAWRYGGEGAGGEPVSGVFPAPGDKPQKPPAADKGKKEAEADKGRKPVREAAPLGVLPVGQWSLPVPVASLSSASRRLVLTVTAGTGGRRVSLNPLVFEGYSTNLTVEFEFALKGKPLKTVRDSADGRVVGVVIPLHLLAKGKAPDSPEFLAELTNLLDYERRRASALQSLPWGAWPLPKRFSILTDMSGFGDTSYHGVRYSSRELALTLAGTLRMLGVNGLRAGPPFLKDMVRTGQGLGAEFRRCTEIHGMGYPVPSVDRREGRAPTAPPEAGCPYGAGVPERTAAAVRSALEEALAQPVGEVWSLTVDEIGAVTDRSLEGKEHLSLCPQCRAGFQAYLKEQGLQPADFGQKDWSEVKPLNVWDKDPANPPWLAEGNRGAALAAYYTRMFNNYASAKLFAPLARAFDEANARKREALADPARQNSAEARQPWVYSFALRGCTFLYGGHSLDFFDFYRLADNAIVYETSNRDPRVWQWDSYLSDVARVVADRTGKQFGIYVKPHRGAPVQRALSAACRGARMIFWYTFGPEYAKGDAFSQNPEHLVRTSKAAHLLGRAEDVLYEARWAEPARVALVSPRSTEIWTGLGGNPAGAATHENAKWTYTALAHAHLAVDPLDEVMLASGDLARYEVLYVIGSHLTRAAAARVAEWVEAGGTLVTCAGGLARDEANQPLAALAPVLGLRERAPLEMWRQVKAYHATDLESFTDPRGALGPVPADARLEGKGLFSGACAPVVGRERLHPGPGAEVLATFADGSAAITRRRHGKGEAYVLGFFPGLEYSAAVRVPEFDMARHFDVILRGFVAAPALARVRPAVEPSVPTVEAVLLANPASGRRAVALMNWTYGVARAVTSTVLVRGQARENVRYERDLVTLRNVRVMLRGVQAERAVSAMLGRAFPFERTSDGLEITLPELADGDVLTLE